MPMYRPHTEESKAKIAAAVSRALKGRPKSEEHKRKLSEANKGKPQGPGQRAAAPGNLARWYATPEGQAFREQMKEVLLRYATSPENIERLRQMSTTPLARKQSEKNWKRVGLFLDHGEALRERDGDLCQLCLEPIDFDIPPRQRWSRSVDHITPVVAGGTGDLDNLWLAHMTCNQRKSAKWIGREDGSTDSRRSK